MDRTAADDHEGGKLQHDNKGVMHAAVGGLEGTVFDNDWGNGGVTGAKGAPPFKKIELEWRLPLHHPMIGCSWS